MPRVDDGDDQGVHVPGLYRRLRDVERVRVRTPDPRWAATDAAQSGESCPLEWMQSALVDLDAMERGERVELPVWWLGGHDEPDERIRRLKREERWISGWLVSADDVVVPVREGRQAGSK